MAGKRRSPPKDSCAITGRLYGPTSRAYARLPKTGDRGAMAYVSSAAFFGAPEAQQRSAIQYAKWVLDNDLRIDHDVAYAVLTGTMSFSEAVAHHEAEGD